VSAEREKLVDDVISQLIMDFRTWDDFTAVEELLRHVPDDALKAFLRE